MSRLVVAASVLLVTVFGLLGAATWNRGGDPQLITLTERELSLPWAWETRAGVDAEGLRLGVDWQRRAEVQDAKVWLTDSRLTDLGFPLQVMPGAPEAAHFYGRMLPRIGWVAFEYDGPAWRTIEQRRVAAQSGADRQTYDRPPAQSRLVPIDAAPTIEPLRRRYAGQAVVILPAIVDMRYELRKDRGPLVWGTVSRLVSDSVMVPLQLRTVLRDLPARQSTAPPGWKPGDPAPEPPEPRYEVDLAVGRLGAVWVRDVRRKGSERF